MTEDRKTQVTEIVARLERRESEAAASPEELMQVVYAEPRRLAAAYLRRERPGHTLQPTALVHEAYLRLVDQTRVGWRGRTHFFAVGARMMRRLLVDHARRRKRAKRGGERLRVTFDEVATPGGGHGLDPTELLALDDALEELARRDARQARVVELRFFAGLKVDEVADLLGVSPRTVKGEWAHAKAWLKQTLAPEQD